MCFANRQEIYGPLLIVFIGTSFLTVFFEPLGNIKTVRNSLVSKSSGHEVSYSIHGICVRGCLVWVVKFSGYCSSFVLFDN